MKNIFSVTAAAAVLFTLAACTTTTTENTASPARSTVQTVQIPEQELRTIATAYAQDVIGGLEKAKAFQERNGKLENLDYLGTLNQGAFKLVVWKARFARTKALEEELKRGGRNPAELPLPDVLIRLLVGNVDGQWKIFAIFMN